MYSPNNGFMSCPPYEEFAFECKSGSLRQRSCGGVAKSAPFRPTGETLLSKTSHGQETGENRNAYPALQRLEMFFKGL